MSRRRTRYAARDARHANAVPAVQAVIDVTGPRGCAAYDPPTMMIAT